MQGHTQKIDTTVGNGGAANPKKLGKYEIIEPIGEGGFGIVYKGFDPFIKRHVAIKTCTSPDKELRQRYFREAEIAGRLDHPNIVRIFDFGTENDTPYLVQEFLAGGDLDHKIEGRQFVPYPERLLYLIQIARGLAYAHDQGVIHRDIKPANIRILEDGSAKIMDFGVAMLQNAETRLTKDGMAVGTAAYLAPEQVKGQDTEPRTDIFSYGVLAYELLTGERPFEQDSISATLYSILHDDVKPITLPTSVCPEALGQLIERCLDKDPMQRPGHFSEILEDLDKIRTQMRSTDPERDFASELRHVTPADRSQNFDPPLRHEWTPPAVRMQRRRRWITTVIPAVVVVVLVTAYAVLASQGIVPWPAAGDAEMATPSVEPVVQELPPPAPEVVNEEIAEPEPEPPPPPVIEKATLTLARGWHEGITASINGGSPLGLSQTRSRELEPGEYTIRYSLATADYQTSRTVRAQLEPGEERTLQNPIGRPGHLSVQASLGSPQGLVAVDGRSVGSSPVRGLVLSPGKHQLQVFATTDPTLPLADATVDIRSSRETVVTFDLTGKRELAFRYRDPSP